MPTATIAGKKVDETLAALNPETIALAKQFQKDMTIDSNGVISIPATVYEGTLPENLTKELITELQRHNTNVVTAATLAVGEVSAPFLKEHKDIKNTNFSMPMVGKDTFNAVYHLSKDAHNPKDGTTGVIHGSVTVSIDSYAVGKRGELNKVKAHLKAAASALFD